MESMLRGNYDFITMVGGVARCVCVWAHSIGVSLCESPNKNL